MRNIRGEGTAKFRVADQSDLTISPALIDSNVTMKKDREQRERDRLRAKMIENAAEINKLHSRVEETFKMRGTGEQPRQEWLQACQEFHTRYNLLCLPGGWDSGFYDRILAGDVTAIEIALCFLEVRPYFFRSGYHWKAILQKCKRAPMVGEQAERFASLLMKHDAWKRRKSKRH